MSSTGLSPQFQAQSGGWRLFIYEVFLEDHQDCQKAVAEGWEDLGKKEDPWENFINRTKNCKRKLTAWHNKNFRDATKEIPKLKHQLDTLLHSDDAVWNLQ